MIERASGVIVGSVLLKALPGGAGEVEIGWQMHPDSWGRGLATEAAGAVLAHGFRHGLDEIWYDHPSLMFWIGAGADQAPSIQPDEPAPARAP